jgi:hypothetical protein
MGEKRSGTRGDLSRFGKSYTSEIVVDDDKPRRQGFARSGLSQRPFGRSVFAFSRVVAQNAKRMLISKRDVF